MTDTQTAADDGRASHVEQDAALDRSRERPPPLPPIEEWEAVAAGRLHDTGREFDELATDATAIVAATRLLHACLLRGNKVLLCGNGGSAAAAQQLSTELMGGLLRDRAPLPAVALTTDTSTLTAIGDDHGFDQVFSRQLRGIGVTGDVLVGLCPSGNSRDVVAAFETARQMGIATVALLGDDGGILEHLADASVRAPSTSAPRIQELHLAIGHTICELLEDALT